MESVLSIHCRGSARRYQGHRTLPATDSLLVPASPSVNSPVGENAVDPAFQDRRNTKPPERKGEDEEIRRLEFPHLRLQRGRKTLMSARVMFFVLGFEIHRIGRRQKIAPIRNRIEAHSVEIRKRHPMSGLLERLLGRAGQRAAKAFRFGMSVNDE